MMRSLKQVPASLIGVEPVYIQGLESHGKLYFSNIHHGSDALGGQCANCNNIVWVVGRDDPVLFESSPEGTPDSGPEYRLYFKDKMERFLAALPFCPVCCACNYDLFVNGAARIRFEDGYPFPPSDSRINKELSAAAKDSLVWLYGK